MKKLPRFWRITIKSLLWLIGIIVVLFFILIGIVYWKKDDIKEYILSELNEGQGGELVIEDVSISPFRAFPYISIDIQGATFYPDKRRFGDPLYHFEDIYVGFSIIDIIKGQYDIKNIIIEDGYVHAERYEDGTLDILFFKESDFPEEEDEEESDIHLNLEHIALKNVLIKEESCHEGQSYNSLLIDYIEATYHSSDEGLHFYIDGDFHVNKIEFDHYTIFHDKNFELHTEINLLNDFNYIEFLPGTLVLGNADLKFGGHIDFENDMYVDLEFDGKKDNFDLFFAFMPEDIVEGLNEFTNSGDIFFKGIIKGKSLHGLPHIDIELGCENTMFENKNTHEKIEDLRFFGRFSSGEDNTPESAFFTLTNLYGKPDKGLFKGTFTMKNLNNPTYTIDFHSEVDLLELQNFIKIPEIEKSSGKVFIDITLNEFVDTDSLLHMATQMEDGVNSGITFNNVYLKFRDYEHPIKNLNGRIELVSDDVVCNDLRMNIEKSDIHFDMKLKNITSLIHHYSAKVDLFLHGYSNRLNFADLLGKDQEGNEIFDDFVTDLDFNLDFHTMSNAFDEFEFFPKMDFYFRNLNFHLNGYPHEIKKMYGLLHLSDEKIELEKFDFEIGNNDLHISTVIHNPKALMSEHTKEKVTFFADLRAKRIDLMELLVYKGEALMDPEIVKEFEKELIRDFSFKGKGSFISNSFYEHGFYSRFNVENFDVKLNDLPMIKNATANIKTDTSGCIYINDFNIHFGKNDMQFDLEMRNFLNPDAKDKPIIADVGGKLWDIDQLVEDLTGRTSSTSSQHASANSHEEAFNIFAIPFPDLKLKAHVDKIKYGKYLLYDFKADMKVTPDHYIYIDNLSMKAADGTVKIKGYFNGSNKDKIYLDSEVDLKEVDLDKLMYKFDNFGQDYVVSNNLHGKLTANIKSKVHVFPDLAVDLGDTKADIKATIKDGRIQNFAPMSALSDFMGDKDLTNIRFAELSNEISYTNGHIKIPEMKIASTLGYMYLRGEQDKDFNIDYEIDVPLELIKEATFNYMRAKLSRKGKVQELDNVEEKIISEQTSKVSRYLTIHMEGPLETYEVEIGKVKKRD